jgi:ubiquinone/menaquinone biosynthesis C-methylase UbiE
VLDVAAGNGNATLAAARRFCDVTSTDYVKSLLDRGQLRAAAEGVTVRFQEADAEALPFGNETFDTVLSTFGVMFAPDQYAAAKELARVTSSGGVIGMASWTAAGFVGQMFKTLGKHLPPPSGMLPPTNWSNKDALEVMFADSVGSISVTHKIFTFRYRSFDHFIDTFRNYYGPMHKAFLALGDKGAAFEDELRELAESFNVGGPDSFVVPSEYAEVIIRK